MKSLEIATQSQVDLSQAFVLREYCEHESKKSFNTDFSWEFYSQEADYPSGNTQPYVVATLPLTIGAEFFVIINKTTRQPVVAETLSGGAFSIKYYRRFINEIEATLDELPVSGKAWNPYPEQYMSETSCDPLRADVLASRRTPLRKSRYLRVFVIHGFICFLSCPKLVTPQQHGTRYRLLENDTSQIDCGFDENGVVYLDGWMKTQQKSDQIPPNYVLWAVPAE